MVLHGPQVQIKKQEYLTDTMAISGGIALVLTAISPILSYLALCAIGYQVIRSKNYWNTLAHQKPADLTQLDNAGMFILGAIGTAGLVLFYQFSLLPQMMFAALAGGGLSWIFIQFITRSQNALNRALKTAAAQSVPTATTYLLQRGADPYFQDKLGNIAFHDAVQNNSTAIYVLNVLKTFSARQNPTFLSIFEPPQDCQMSARAGEFVDTFINCRDFKAKNRAILLAAMKNVLEEAYHYLANMTQAFVLYYRSKIAYPKDMHSRNNAGNTPGDFLNILNIDLNHRPEMAKLLELQADPIPAPSAPPMLIAKDPSPIAPPASLMTVAKEESAEISVEETAKIDDESEPNTQTSLNLGVGAA